MKKRVLAIMLACLMLVSLLPMGALAAGEQLTCPGKGENHYLGECPSTFVETVAPICGDANSFGYDLYTCDTCGDYFAANFVQGNKDEKHDYVLVEDKDGYCAEYVCSKCGSVDPKGSHDWNKATCTEPATCKVCGKTDGKAAGHTWGDAPSSILVEPNEDTFESGWAEYTCSVCKATKTVEILAHECKDNWILVEAKEATCVENGNKEHYACQKCDRLYAYNEKGVLVEVTAADVTITGKHTVPVEVMDFGAFVIENPVYTDVDGDGIAKQDPTCKVPGYIEYICSTCKEKVKEVLPVVHDWEVEHEAKPTCAAYGYSVYVCRTCGENKFEVTAPTGHSERPENADYVEPTCTTNAYYEWLCTKCYNYVQEEVEGSALGHDVKTVTVPATCGSYGYTYTYCARVFENWYGEGYHATCQDFTGVYSLSSTIPGDSDGDGKIEKDEVITLTVSLPEREAGVIGGWPVISFKIDVASGYSKTNHMEPDDANAILKEATCTENGLKAFWCANCEESVVEIIPATGHTKASKPTTVPATCQNKGYVAYLCTTCGKVAEIVEELTYSNEVIYESYDDIAYQHVDKNGVCTLIETGDWTPEDYDGCPAIGMKRYECSLCKEVMLVKGAHKAPADLPEKVVTMTFSSKDNWGYHAIENPFYGYDAYVTYTVIAPEGYVENEHYQVMYGSTEVVPADLEQLIVYINSWYGDEIIVVATFTFDYFKAAAPTCEADGYTAQYCCTECGLLIESETYKVLETDKDGKPTKELHPELKALGHDKVVLVEAIKDTCTTVGRTEGWFCKTCGKEEKSVEVDKIKGHKLVASEENAFSKDPISGNLVVCANGCGYEAIINYNRICDHDWVLNRKECVASTCTKAGKDVYTCSICGANKVIELELAAHVNKAGQVILECSETPKDDRTCVNCKTEINYNGQGHILNTKVYEATCLRPAYLMITCTCTGCDYAVAYEYGEPTGHAWKWEAYVKDEKTGVIVGGAYRCQTCGLSEVRSLENIAFSFTIENAANAKGEITDGSLVKLTVYVTGKADGVWGFKFDIPYSDNMTLVKTNYCVDVSDDFVIYGNANSVKDGGQWVTVAGNANGSENVTINSTIALVELYFVVDQDLPDVVSADIENVEVLNYKSEKLGFIAYGIEAKTVALMDVKADGKLNMEDILATYKLIVDGKYSAAADIDKNGVVEAADLQAMYKYLIGAKTYAATRKTGIAAT